METNLDRILTDVYGEEVRKAIVFAIKECYDEIESPTISFESYKEAIEVAILEDLFGSIIVPDDSVTRNKFDSSFLEELTSEQVLTDPNGNKYRIVIDEYGNITTEKQ